MRLKEKQLKTKERNLCPPGGTGMTHKEQVDQARYYGEKTWRKWRHNKHLQDFDGAICPGGSFTNEFAGDASARAYEAMMQACHDRWAKIYPEKAARWAANQ